MTKSNPNQALQQLLLTTFKGIINASHLIELEIRRLCMRFGHPLVKHLLIFFNYSTNFNSAEFRGSLRSVGTTLKLILIKAHHLIRKVERYHRPLRRAFEIMIAKNPRLTNEERLKIAIEAVNDIAGPHRLIPTLLVFGAYPRLTELDPPNPLVEQRAAIIRK
ncbi:unnamed protein product [Diplocarpon coronariae]